MDTLRPWGAKTGHEQAPALLLSSGNTKSPYSGLRAVMSTNLMRPMLKPRFMSGITTAPCMQSACKSQHQPLPFGGFPPVCCSAEACTACSPVGCGRSKQRIQAQAGQGGTLMVFQPAVNRPLRPCQLSAESMTASQKGATSSDQSAVLMSCDTWHPTPMSLPST